MYLYTAVFWTYSSPKAGEVPSVAGPQQYQGKVSIPTSQGGEGGGELPAGHDGQAPPHCGLGPVHPRGIGAINVVL